MPTALSTPTDAIQRYIAVTSVGASAVRGSPSGTADAARDFLALVPLRQLGVSQQRVFATRLDRLTEELRRSLPPGRKHWGLSRKLLNIFLHNALYNHYLRSKYRLDRAENFFEVPMDSLVARALRRDAHPQELSRWPGLNRLTPSQNEMYQRRAATLARSMNIARVHLDAILWVQER